MNETEVICRFCLKTIKKPLPIDKMTEEIIETLMLRLDLRITSEPVMCYGCVETLQTASDFESACIYTKNCLYPFIEGKSEAGLDLREIYLKINNEDVESVKGREVCRFCMKASDSDRCTPIEVIEEKVEIKKLLENYFPEVVMQVIEKPVACENCYNFLHQYSLFVTSISNVEQQIQSYAKKMLGRDYVAEVDLRQVREFSLSNVTKRKVETIGNEKVTKEEVMIFSEMESKEKIIPEEKIKCEEIGNSESKIFMASPEIGRREQEEFDGFAGNNELFMLIQTPVVEEAQGDVDMKRPFLKQIETEVKGKYLEEDAVHVEEMKGESEESQRNENDTLILIDPGVIYSEDAEMKPTVVDMSCNPEENHMAIENGPDPNTSEMEAGNPAGHQAKSVEHVEGRIYRCKHCPYKTKLRYYLPKHMLVHKDISEVTAHRCKLCPFKTKWKRGLTVHMLIHKDPSKTPTYDCNLCPYKAIRKYSLRNHMLIHKNAYRREAAIRQCALCPYKTKGKSNMTNHMQTHVTYDCKICSFKTKLKRHLTRHMLIHKADSKKASEMETKSPNGLQVKSDEVGKETVSQQTERKSEPIGHMLGHEDSFDVTTYSCTLCSYKADQKDRLTAHMLVHENTSENASETVELEEEGEEIIYRCKLCPYKAKLKHSLTSHMLVHKDISEMTTYHCSFCPYKAKRRQDLTKHVMLHKDFSGIPTYDCSFCSYKTKRKRDLPRHMLVHKDISEVTTYDCNFCSYKTKRKRDLTVHKLIHKDDPKVKSEEDVEERIYRCKLCPYTAEVKQYMAKHMLKHKDISEVKAHRCELCPHVTKRKHDLTIHIMRMHKSSSKDAKFAQTRQERMSEHQELEGCSIIKSEEVDIKDEEDE